MAVLDSRYIDSQEARALLDSTLGQLFLFAQCLQSLADDHHGLLEIVLYPSIEHGKLTHLGRFTVSPQVHRQSQPWCFC